MALAHEGRRPQPIAPLVFLGVMAAISLMLSIDSLVNGLFALAALFAVLPVMFAWLLWYRHRLHGAARRAEPVNLAVLTTAGEPYTPGDPSASIELAPARVVRNVLTSFAGAGLVVGLQAIIVDPPAPLVTYLGAVLVLPWAILRDPAVWRLQQPSTRAHGTHAPV